ncbi:MAG: MFS transporter, partial [Clostridiales bacterium]|nr:MFS transporter [Clostridiales bacterium]
GNYGIMFIGVAMAGYFGPQNMRSVYNGSGAYRNAFLIACVLSGIGIVLTMLYRLMTARKA